MATLGEAGVDARIPDHRPERKPQYHMPPFWVSEHAVFFVTIKCQVPGRNQLANNSVAEALIAGWQHYHSMGDCCVHALVIMPDHLHLMLSFSWEPGKGMPKLIENWKRFTARKYEISWQRGFFDHRIRNEKDHDQKWHYIVQNPYHAGLVTELEP